MKNGSVPKKTTGPTGPHRLPSSNPNPKLAFGEAGGLFPYPKKLT